MKNYVIAIVLTVSGCAGPREATFSNLATVLDVSRVNGVQRNPNNPCDHPWDLLFSESSPEEIAIANWKEVLNGESEQLLACLGNVFANGQTGLVVGQSSEGPTFGKLLIYDRNLKLAASCDCQKVVRMKLVDLLGDGVKEIVTWEDHHYGTDTTRRVLALYKADALGRPTKVFEHNLVDQTYARELDYTIDFTSQVAQKRIIVSSDEGKKTLYSWNAAIYEVIPGT